MLLVGLIEETFFKRKKAKLKGYKIFKAWAKKFVLISK